MSASNTTRRSISNLRAIVNNNNYDISKNNKVSEPYIPQKEINSLNKKNATQFNNENQPISSNDINQNYIENLQIFDPNFAYGIPITLLKSPKEGCEKLVDILKDLTDAGRIDWYRDANNKYLIDGRIYEANDDAEFRCQIYRLEEDVNKAVLEFSRTGGDSCAFLEFRTTVCNKLKDYIVNNLNDISANSERCDIDNDIDISSEPSFFSKESTMDIDRAIQELSISDNDDNITCEEIIKNVKNRGCCREIYRDYITTLQHIITDTKKAEMLAQLNNIFEDLLSPMEDGPNTLLDCWIIKNLLEIVFKLLPLSKSKCPTDKIEAIKTKWRKPVHHPLGIVSFFPSQQICSLCDSCLNVALK